MRLADADNQALMANTLAYAPVNPAAFADVEESVLPWLATSEENQAKGFLIDAAYWARQSGRADRTLDRMEAHPN